MTNEIDKIDLSKCTEMKKQKIDKIIMSKEIH